MVSGSPPGPAPPAQARPSSSPATRSSWRTWPGVKLRRKVPRDPGNCRQSMYEQVPRERRVLLVVNGARGSRAGPGGPTLDGTARFAPGNPSSSAQHALTPGEHRTSHPPYEVPPNGSRSLSVPQWEPADTRTSTIGIRHPKVGEWHHWFRALCAHRRSGPHCWRGRSRRWDKDRRNGCRNPRLPHCTSGTADSA